MGRGRHNVKISFCMCVVTSILPLIGPMCECYIVDDIIEVDELDEGKIFAAAGKQDQ